MLFSFLKRSFAIPMRYRIKENGRKNSKYKMKSDNSVEIDERESEYF